jgi:hypothetical protein
LLVSVFYYDLLIDFNARKVLNTFSYTNVPMA